MTKIIIFTRRWSDRKKHFFESMATIQKSFIRWRALIVNNKFLRHIYQKLRKYAALRRKSPSPVSFIMKLFQWMQKFGSRNTTFDDFQSDQLQRSQYSKNFFHKTSSNRQLFILCETCTVNMKIRTTLEMNSMYLKSLEILRNKDIDLNSYPFSIPAIKNLKSISFRSNITFLSGKTVPENQRSLRQ